MATQDQTGNNRYTDAMSSEDTVNQINNDDIVLNILKDEFPDDPLFAQDMLTVPSEEQQALDSLKTEEEIRQSRELVPALRNTKNVLNLSTEREEYTKYDLAKTYPTIDEDELDDLIDEEWEYFLPTIPGPAQEPVAPIKQSGLFLVNSRMDLRDAHDLYINDGPQNIEADSSNITDRVFCVFFVNNGVAYAIPTYKTLEVMLVERGLTYDAILEATAEQIKEFDLLIDGEGAESIMTPLEEFQQRTYPVRDSDWDVKTRYRSGYRPLEPFVRDPGEYVKPDSINVDIDGDRYFELVFQKQTYREKLREKFEGKMIIADWPAPEYDGSKVTFDTSIRSDDAVLNLRMMINGHWKLINDGAVMKLYAYLNDYDLSSFRQGVGRYGPKGYIQLLIDAGGCTIVQAADGSKFINDVLAGNSDIANEVEPLWNAFPHIVDADDDDLKGVDRAEYQEYLDNFTNGGAPFDIEYLEPYEPRGSIKYYPKQQYQDLVNQAIQQGEIDVVKEQIYEIWPGVASLIENTKIQFDQISNLKSYVTDKLGEEGPLFNVLMSDDGEWSYYKSKSSGLKLKGSHTRLFKLCSQKLRIKTSLNEEEENALVSNFQWMKTINRGFVEKHRLSLTIPPVGPGVSIANAFDNIVNSVTTPANWSNEIPTPIDSTMDIFPGINDWWASLKSDFISNLFAGISQGDDYEFPKWRFVAQREHLTSCIVNEIDGHMAGFYMAASRADSHYGVIYDIINSAHIDVGQLDTAILEADSVEEFADIYERLLIMQDICDELNQPGGMSSLTLELKAEIDIYVKDQLKRQYNMIQYLREKVFLDTKKKKYGIVWPIGPQNIMNEYVPGCVFDNFQPPEE